MKAVILAGGRGERLGSITESVPKPLVLLKGKPILTHCLEFFVGCGITDFILCIGYRGDQIKEYYGDGSALGISITFIEEVSPLGTAGPLKHAEHLLTETFAVCNADNLFNLNFPDMIAVHKAEGGMATIALTQVEDTTQYGIAQLESTRIMRFVEKPQLEDAPSRYANAGLYVMEPSVLALIPQRRCSLEREIFPLLAEQGHLVGFGFEGQWFDTGTPERLERAEREWLL